MSSSDLWMRDLLTKYGLVSLITTLVLLVLLWKWSRFRQNNFKAHLLGFECECADLASDHKKRLFSTLDRTFSHDELLRSLNRIRILEIGVKTGQVAINRMQLRLMAYDSDGDFAGAIRSLFAGENIRYYPEATHFIGVDWNRKLGEYLVNGDKSWQFAHVIFERLIIGDGSCLRAVPTGCVDIVVTTRSLCSTSSIDRTLEEIHRVLAVGGKYLFMEHLPDRQGSIVRWMQMILTKTRIWPSLFGGCKLDCDPTKAIENSGFTNVQWEHVVLHGYVSQPHHLLLSRHHIVGSACR